MFSFVFFTLTSWHIVVGNFVKSDNSMLKFDIQKTLLDQCLLYPSILSPNLIETELKTGIQVQLFINQLHDLDAVSRTFSLTGILIISWIVPCVERLYKNGTNWPNKELTPFVQLDPSLFWRPLILHRTGYNQINLQSMDETFVVVNMSNGEFFEYLSGMFTILCPLDFKDFPYDKQTCKIHLMTGLVSYAYFEKATVTLLPGAIEENMNWEIIGMETKNNDEGFNNQPEAFLIFHFKRKPFYYIVTMIIPGLVLHCLVLVSYFLPPDTTDRTVYTVTVELAFYLFQVDFNRALPQSSTPINMQIYLIGMLIGSTIMTIYSAILCYIANIKPKIVKKKVHVLGKQYELIYVVDFFISLCFFLISGSLAVISNVMSASD